MPMLQKNYQDMAPYGIGIEQVIRLKKMDGGRWIRGPLVSSDHNR